MNKLKNKKTRYFLIVFFVLLFFIYLFSGHYRCMTKAITGIPCPGCGMTRAWLALIKGNITEAFFYHPLFWIPPVILLLLLVQKRMKWTIPKWIWIAVLLIYLLVYVIRMYLYFPHSEPMNMDTHALLPGIYHQLKSLFLNRIILFVEISHIL